MKTDVRNYKNLTYQSYVSEYFLFVNCRSISLLKNAHKYYNNLIVMQEKLFSQFNPLLFELFFCFSMFVRIKPKKGYLRLPTHSRTAHRKIF